MIHSTKGIVLRAIKYGETSVIVHIFTELFGVQSYIINGVRTAGKNSKAHFFQPASMLDLQVYHNDLKNLQRIKEVKWQLLYNNVLSDVTRNCVALYMVELLFKCLKQPETNENLFHFAEDALLHLDSAPIEVAANFPIYFSIQTAQILGFGLSDNYSSRRNTFDIREGNFCYENNASSSVLNKSVSSHLSQILKAIHPHELLEIKMNRTNRKEILQGLENYYSWHIQDFGKMKTLHVLSEIF